MADAEHAKAENLKIIKKGLSAITGHTPTTIGMDAKLGDINFRTGQAIFQEVHKFAKELDSLPFEALPAGGVNWSQLASTTTNVSKTISAIATFTLAGKDNPESQRDGLICNMKAQHDQLQQHFYPHIPYLTLRSAQVFEVVKQSKQLLADTQTVCDDAVHHANQQNDTLDGIVEAAKDAAAKTGVAQLATDFDKIANRHDELSNRWLNTASLFGVVTLAATGLFVRLGPTWPIVSAPTDPSVFHYVLTKLA